ncbi:unnamed protein product [Rotaria sp. Silwood2]|nr:unnamed protein product [Rotaria sp. Silwood2]CAF2945385.1 unnamed protein product [Rotaria sp. Silwood2]CAF3102731.1 unnamed protein product [Rotaria sp. Silwood2]CAF4424553.1 unnamed protein product [Rotaria sp. Silwood2]CAF4437959.1 unnamed protein product [Rotaria sp. Silwood2]
MKKDRTKSSQMVAGEWTLSNGTKLYATTVCRRLIEHEHWLDEWNNVMWSDETHFEVLNRKNGTYIHRLQSEIDQPFNFTPRAQGGGGCASVWGCISGGARGQRMVYNGRLNGPAY